MVWKFNGATWGSEYNLEWDSIVEFNYSYKRSKDLARMSIGDKDFFCEEIICTNTSELGKITSKYYFEASLGIVKCQLDTKKGYKISLICSDFNEAN